MEHSKYIWTDEIWTYILKIHKTKNGFEGEYEGRISPAHTPDSAMTCSGSTVDEVLDESAKELLYRRNMKVIWELITE